jgi:pimeloyl-ACP methyl ester carboxylesterase
LTSAAGVFAALLGLLLVALPVRAEPRLSTVTGAGGVPLLVAEEGDPRAPGILFIHGFAQSYLSFRRQFASELAGRYHLVAFDLRGHGGSGKPYTEDAYGPSQVWAEDVAAVIRATHLVHPVIVAWSYGGFVAMDYVRHYGVGQIAGIDMVGSLGGLAGSPAFSAGDSDAARAMRTRSEHQRSLNLLDNVTAGKETAAGYVTSNMTDEDRDILFATEMMMPSYARRLMGARKLDNVDVVPKVTVPVLFTRGSYDVTMPMDGLEKLLKELPNAKLSAYDKTGHLTFIEHTERFDQELDAFAVACGAR